MSLQNPPSATINLVGDVQPHRAEPETLFRHVHDFLAEGDLNICQLECTISDKGILNRDVRNPAHRVPSKNIGALSSAPFHGITFAGNNNLDYGLEAFEDTIERVQAANLLVVGAGKNLEEATRAVVSEINGVRIAMVNNCSILPHGYAATDEMPGIAPLPVKTFYEPLEKLNEQPGTPARTLTIADQDRLDVILDEIRSADAAADYVIAFFHWGVHFTHDLAQYQADVAYQAIEAGADIVVGTHPHCLQAIDVHQGKPIFYSLGNFAFEQPGATAMAGAGSYLRLYGMPADETVPGHPHPAHCRPSVVVQLKIDSAGNSSIELIPTYLNDSCEPEVASPGSPEFDAVKKLLVGLSAEIGTEIVQQGEALQINLDREESDTRAILRRRNVSYPSLRHLSTETV